VTQAGQKSDRSGPGISERRAMSVDFYGTIQALLIGRTIACLGEGGYGIVLDFAETGDLVCLLMGCGALVILRR
jgi:hypothetical protein